MFAGVASVAFVASVRSPTFGIGQEIDASFIDRVVQVQLVFEPTAMRHQSLSE